MAPQKGYHKRKKKKPAAQAASRGLDARRLASGAPPASVDTLGRTIVDDGGSVLATYRDPLGGHWQLLAALPIDRVEPTPYQRDLSEAHVGTRCQRDRQARSLSRSGHRGSRRQRHVLVAERLPSARRDARARRQVDRRARGAGARGGAPDSVAQYGEGAQPSRDARSRWLDSPRALSVLDDRPEREFATEFEEAALVTLGLCYQQNGRFCRRRVPSRAQAVRQVPRLQAAQRAGDASCSAPRSCSSSMSW